ncbi:hypothetical protein HXX25_02645 [Hyphobacterium sp. CCMP332]|uniref:hypothetical protein n=1 Tax=Hyphobacterium sp. CCMP332 TaxID=2749086 RepID=UPI001650408B|nr:hypothetical protein [Hyphobacterium sp. CCMP332]QNL18329.1 hypothetical protein HXX25_02645 [Hyphobacterium sp. CCMP332]
MFRLFCTVVWLVSSLSASQAQVSDDYIDAINHAIFIAEDGDLAAGYDAATGLLDIADTDEERLRAYDLAMNIAMAAGRWLDAENQAFAGAQLVRENLGGQPDLLRPFLERQAEAARQQDALDRHQRLQAELLSLNAGRLALVWNAERDGQRHRFTGFLCPQALNDWPLSQWQADSPSGLGANCIYLDPAAPGSGLSFNIYRPADQDHIANIAAVFSAEMAQTEFIEGVPLIHNGQALTYHVANLDDRAMQVWRALSGDWAVTLDSYSDTAIPEVLHDDLLTEAFASLERMNEHLSRCDLSRGRREFGREEEIAGVSLTMLTASMLPHPVGVFQPDDNTLDCFIQRLDIGSLAIAYAEVDRRGRPQRFVARPSDGEVPYILAAESRSLRNVERSMGRTRSGTPFIMSQHLDRQVDTYGVYNGPPSALGFLDHIAQIAAGDIEPSIGVYIDADGQSIINISNATDD